MAATNLFSYESLLATAHQLRLVDVTCALVAVYVLVKVGQIALGRGKSTALRGPPSPSIFWGVEQELQTSADAGKVYEKWAEEYGEVYEIPSALGGRRIILSDPRAVAHFYGGGASTYAQIPAARIGTEHLVGKGLLTATGDSHRRQRKAFTPAFSNAAIRNLTSVFYDSAYKVKTAWDTMIESNGSGSAVIDIQDWMKLISLDTIGIAGFSHDFGSLDGKQALVGTVLADLGAVYSSTMMLLFMPLAMALPWMMNLPTSYTRLIKKLNDAMDEISNHVLARSRKEKQAGALADREEKSILGLLIKAESQNGQLHLSTDEVAAQAKVLLLAGYDTTSIALAWALIELCKNPNVQTKLRAEIMEFGGDPSYDQLANSLPYLDGFIHEMLRMHPPHTTSLRIAVEDDVVPLSKPAYTQSGELVNHISIAKGADVLVPIWAMNRSTALWGPDAKEFKPERWIEQDGIPARAKEIQGHHHLLTFIDGPRTCPGKAFALTELKMVLAVLVRNFAFEFVGGPKTEIGMAGGIVPRPKVAGEQADAIPMRVTRLE